jgi:hypothetical protein
MVTAMVDRLITFSEFDVFAYLVVGLVLLAVCDLIFHIRVILRPKWGFGDGLMIVVTAYVLGHLVAIPGHWFIEEGLAKRVLKAPQTLVSDQLYEARCKGPGQREQPDWLHATIFAHDEPLSCAVLDKLKTRLPKDETLLGNFYPLLERGIVAARPDPFARDRMQIFLRLYIFSRNMACVAFLGALIILITPIFHRYWPVISETRFGHRVTALWLRGASLPAADETVTPIPGTAIPGWLTNRVSLFAALFIFGLGLLYRHLMFLRLFDAEALTAYAYALGPVGD